MKTLTWITITISALVSFVYSQTPTEVTRNYFEAFKAGEYEKVAKLIEPNELKEFRNGFKFAENLPDEKAKQFCATFLGPDVTLEGFKAMSDVEFYSAFMTSSMSMMGGGNEVKFEDEKILEEKIEGDTTARVNTKYQVVIAEESSEQSEVIEYRKSDGKWMMVLPESLKQATAGIKAAFEQGG